MLLLNVVIRQLCFLHLLCYVMSCRGWISDRYLSESWIRQICQFLQSRLTRYFLRIGGWLVVCPVGGLSSSGEMRLVHQGGSGVKRQLAKYGKRGENSLYILWKWEGFKTKLYFCRLWVYMMHIMHALSGEKWKNLFCLQNIIRKINILQMTVYLILFVQISESWSWLNLRCGANCHKKCQYLWK